VDHIILPMTAGRDSRIILAAILKAGLAGATSCVTDGDPRSTDCLSGRTLSVAFQLPWEGESTAKGCCLNGFGGEILKGYWYRSMPDSGAWRDRVLASIPGSIEESVGK
jgi:hypothetical protein